MDPNSQTSETDAAPQDGATQTDATPQSEPATGDNGRTDSPQASDSWHRQLRLDLRGNEALAGINSPSELAERYIEQQKNGITVPGEDATDEDRAAYYQKMGVPESPEGYQLEPNDIVPEKYVNDFAQRAHEAHLTPEQAKTLYEQNVEAHRSALEEHNKAADAAEKGLREEWSDDYEANAEAAVEAARKLGGDKLAKTLAELPATVSVDLFRAFHQVATMISEDRGPAGQPGSLGGTDGRSINTGLPMLDFGRSS